MLKQSNAPKKIQSRMGSILAVIPLSPNQWTVLSLIAAIVAAIMIGLGNLVPGLALFALAGALDMVDGAVARARGEVTDLGGFIDGVSDRFVEALFLFSFMFYPLPTIFIDPKIWLASLIFLGTCMPSFIRAYADHKKVITHEEALALGGFFERSERIILIVLGLVFGLVWGMQFFIAYIIAASVFSLVTIIQRLAAIMYPKSPGIPPSRT